MSNPEHFQQPRPKEFVPEPDEITQIEHYFVLDGSLSFGEAGIVAHTASGRGLWRISGYSLEKGRMVCAESNHADGIGVEQGGRSSRTVWRFRPLRGRDCYMTNGLVVQKHRLEGCRSSEGVLVKFDDNLRLRILQDKEADEPINDDDGNSTAKGPGHSTFIVEPRTANEKIWRNDEVGAELRCAIFRDGEPFPFSELEGDNGALREYPYHEQPIEFTVVYRFAIFKDGILDDLLGQPDQSLYNALSSSLFNEWALLKTWNQVVNLEQTREEEELIMPEVKKVDLAVRQGKKRLGHEYKPAPQRNPYMIFLFRRHLEHIFFAFRFLLMMHILLSHENLVFPPPIALQYLALIRQTCVRHLIRVFQCNAADDGSWAKSYWPSGSTESNSKSFTTGCLHHLKLYEFLKVFPDEINIVSHLLKSRTAQWAESLQHSRHMSKLWFDHITAVEVKFQGLEYRDGYTLEVPKYKLSELLILWLSIRGVNEILNSKGLLDTLDTRSLQILNEKLSKLNSDIIRKLTLEAFAINMSDIKSTEQHYIYTKQSRDQSSSTQARNASARQIVFSRAADDSTRSFPYANETVKNLANQDTADLGNRIQHYALSYMARNYIKQQLGADRQKLMAQIAQTARNLKKEGTENCATTPQIRQSNTKGEYELGETVRMLAQEDKNQTSAALELDLKLQEIENDLGLFEQRFNVAIQESGAIYEISTGSHNSHTPAQVANSIATFQVPTILLEHVFPHCSLNELRLPQTVPSNSKQKTRNRKFQQVALTKKKIKLRHSPIDRENIIDGPNVSRDWLSRYPDIFNQEVPDFNLEFGQQILGDLWLPYNFWESASDDGQEVLIEDVAVGNIAQKIDHNWYTSDNLREKLRQKRTFEAAEKRLFYLDAFSSAVAIMLCMAVPKREVEHLAMFFCRYGLGSNMYQEWVHPTANIWESELHLQWFQVVPPGLLSITRHGFKELPESSFSFTLSRGSFAQDCPDDRYWTCHLLSRLPYRSEAWDIKNKEDPRPWLDVDDRQDQRKVLEFYLFEKMTNEIYDSGQRIESEMRYDRATAFRQMLQLLEKLENNYDAIIETLTDWEKCQERRPFQPRWSMKDELECRDKLFYHYSRAQRNVERIKMQRKKIDGLAATFTFHSGLAQADLQLAETKRSTLTSENVKLLTYITIIFLPMSFSSSLFSMDAAPSGSILALMVPTTIVAVAITVLFVANLNLLNAEVRPLLKRLVTSLEDQMRQGLVIWEVDWRAERLRLAFSKEPDSGWMLLMRAICWILTQPTMCVSELIITVQTRRLRIAPQLVYFVLAPLLAPIWLLVAILQIVIECATHPTRAWVALRYSVAPDLMPHPPELTSASGEPMEEDEPRDPRPLEYRRYNLRRWIISRDITNPQVMLVSIGKAVTRILRCFTNVKSGPRLAPTPESYTQANSVGS
ncbi:hypothetical protein AJ80_01224 [Polytolypa hystricis UAMH7299]|uniref:Uncharacterized protein n=1 Tax=Polytolypa hystricis (strain UAMH7299) TaxID=1447883 RepID=A0A2B7Z1C3_POLH7|nr:hypothetical protein AJ80_01224 [Polytolypa hystricis UAMH7299]